MDPLQIFKALSDRTRLRCILLLAANDELCVCELTHALDLPQPRISHHLGALRKAGVVVDRKEGFWTYYRIDPELPAWAQGVIDAARQAAQDEAPYAADQAALETMPNRPGAACCA
jgi:ArsR family transcriptional regulator, arsenate/arsenite/antimonite-responsive transcriptional repressor